MWYLIYKLEVVDVSGMSFLLIVVFCCVYRIVCTLLRLLLSCIIAYLIIIGIDSDAYISLLVEEVGSSGKTILNSYGIFIRDGHPFMIKDWLPANHTKYMAEYTIRIHCIYTFE